MGKKEMKLGEKSGGGKTKAISLLKTCIITEKLF